MKTIDIANLITAIFDKSRGSIEPKALYSDLDNAIIHSLLKFIVLNEDTFHTFSRSIGLQKMVFGTWGYFSPRYQKVVVNEVLVNGLSKLLKHGLGEEYLHELIETMLHEHRHCYQRKYDLPMTKVPYVNPKLDYEGYFNHPMEVDAREKASEYLDAALAYMYDFISQKYNMCEESTI